MHLLPGMKSCIKSPILQHFYDCYWQLALSTMYLANNRLYNVEVVPAMKAFFISLGILETFTNQVSIGNKIKVRRTEEKNISTFSSRQFWQRQKTPLPTDVIYSKWLKARDVLCSCHLQIMDLSYMMWEDEGIENGGCYWFFVWMFMERSTLLCWYTERAQ